MMTKIRARKQLISLDLTAMVDLGFLLITFFMLQTMLTKPKAMELNTFDAYKIRDEQPPLCGGLITLSILLGEKDKIYTYVSVDSPQIQIADFSKTGIRAVILARQAEVEAQWGNKELLRLLIRAMPNARYKNLIDILDEIAITGVRNYAIVDIDCNDKAIMKATGAAEQ
jgi:biopolymer transport protein ExbD